MREGILWDLLGRSHHEDMREVTVSQFMRRYHVDAAQAGRVEATTLALLAGTSHTDAAALRFARWAARLHEIGLSIAHSGQHRHAAYILENADMPGFSRQDQAFLARIVRASRGGLAKLALAADDPAWRLILPLRLAVLLNQNRIGKGMADVRLQCRAGACTLNLGHPDAQDGPLTRAALEVEVRQWQDLAASWRLLRVGR
jgi:exopolyphosphatase/guanosine-5'-triphosphate,3'-diphosphate pyrophosphatase